MSSHISVGVWRELILAVQLKIFDLSTEMF